LSEQGYAKSQTIRKLEDVLRELEGDRGPTRDPDLYFFTFFGEPSVNGPWGWRYEGHHCSQNWTIVNGRAISSSPQFFGANPAAVHDGPMKGTRVLSAEEDLGRSLVKSLSTAQGSTFLIEYDNTQNHANHIHCVWRDFNGDWGEDLPAEHYRNSPHHSSAGAD
jgi:hypothetical protein